MVSLTGGNAFGNICAPAPNAAPHSKKSKLSLSQWTPCPFPIQAKTTASASGPRLLLACRNANRVGGKICLLPVVSSPPGLLPPLLLLHSLRADLLDARPFVQLVRKPS